MLFFRFMKKIFFLLWISIGSFAQTLSKTSEVSLLTISPGSELYSTFGHSAIRINDREQGFDRNYNYGSFDFNAPNFYLRFLRGTLPYQISAHDFYLEMDYWSNREGRGVVEQVLNLNQSQKQRLLELLEENLRPENREYSYKFFTDNCSTRLRDIFLKATNDSLKFNNTIHADSTFRQWIDKYAMANNKSWADFGMDLAIGVPSDAMTGWSNAMFIPDNLKDALTGAKIIQNGIEIAFVKEARVLAFPINQLESDTFTPNTAIIILGLLIILFTLYQFFYKKRGLFFDKILYSVLGLAGIILSALWFLTNHGVTEMNLNTLWCFPFLFPMFLLFSKNKIKLSLLLKIYLACITLVLCFGWAMPQSFNPAIYPLVFALIFRTTFLIWKAKN